MKNSNMHNIIKYKILRNKFGQKIWKAFTESCQKIAEIRKDLNKWRNILCLWVKRYNIVKKSVLHNFIYKFNTISIKISAEICRNWKSGSKIYMEIQRTQISQNNIEGELILLTQDLI